MISQYQADKRHPRISDIRRISGPLLDRIDIHIDVPRVEYEKLSDERLGEPSSVIKARVEAARAVQWCRFVGTVRFPNLGSIGQKRVECDIMDHR